eukprot:TRINITY_DN67339_c0_g1_i1.p1 TRINITY_DN67339_c0_g1~~TRINITY_DN67339_c0_g1_i1.p1  ORF type:complete len:351 (-),score=66.41 TRINITY_DN67339_c0_g1_i1:276-1328(-)
MVGPRAATRLQVVPATLLYWSAIVAGAASGATSASFATAAAAAMGSSGKSVRSFRGSTGRGVGVLPAIDLYRRKAQQYERDATEAEAAAEYYSKLAAQAVRTSQLRTASRTAQALQKDGIAGIARRTLHVERLMANKLPEQAVAAGLQARIPYDRRYKQYQEAQGKYDEAARGYGARASMDKAQAKDLVALAKQEELEGDTAMGGTYMEQANLLTSQGNKLQALADSYREMDGKLKRALPIIEERAKQAQRFMDWKINPGRLPLPQDMWTFTVAPPLTAIMPVPGIPLGYGAPAPAVAAATLGAGMQAGAPPAYAAQAFAPLPYTAQAAAAPVYGAQASAYGPQALPALR